MRDTIKTFRKIQTDMCKSVCFLEEHRSSKYKVAVVVKICSCFYKNQIGNVSRKVVKYFIIY